MVAPVTGFLLVLLLEILFKIEPSKLLSSILNLVVVSIIAFVVFPRLLGIPFGKVETKEFNHKVGFYFPAGAWKHVLLGLVLAGCTLFGMLIASAITGRYVLDVTTINLPQLVFSLNPALWEELFYRGVLMVFLLKITRSMTKAFLIQIVLFGVMHIKGLDFWALVDVFSVMVLAVGYTYAAHKTQVLVAGIVFHYFHDAFLYFVQVPDGIYYGVYENVVFFGVLWLMVGIGCVITRFAADRLDVRASVELYAS